MLVRFEFVMWLSLQLGWIASADLFESMVVVLFAMGSRSFCITANDSPESYFEHYFVQFSELFFYFQQARNVSSRVVTTKCLASQSTLRPVLSSHKRLVVFLFSVG